MARVAIGIQNKARVSLEIADNLPDAVKRHMDYYGTGDKAKYLLTKGGVQFMRRLHEAYPEAYEAYLKYIKVLQGSVD